jgi:triacylglycerol lipase
MSFLTTLPKGRYDPQAFAGFDPSLTDFSLKNAYALAWACQLAYETADPLKVASIAGLWNIELFPDSIISVESATVLPRSSTHLFVGRCRGAIIIAFAGTDPVSLANWISDFDLGITRSGAANGFAEAAQSVWPRIEDLLRTRGEAGPIFVTGHSLGAALAAITASNIETAFPGRLRAVFAFGMPRTGNQQFASAYNQALGARTFRLVHGQDLVPTVPPSGLNDSRHVGRLLTCLRLSTFVAGDLAVATNSDEPQFVPGVSHELRALLEQPSSAAISLGTRLGLAIGLVFGINPGGLRSDPGGIAIELLPPRLRDHMPDRYIAATKSSS